MQGEGVGVDKSINTVPQTPLSHLQSRFAILDLNGETRIVDRQQISAKDNSEVFYYKKADAELHMRRELEVLPIASKPTDVIRDFWINPHTHVYNKIAFSPLETSPRTLNYWRGPVVTPMQGNWSGIQDYLFEIICSSDRVSFEYLISYLAHMFQKPEEKSGVMIVLLGGQGTGKGVFFQLLKQIWSNSTLLISDIEQVLGRFNAVLERNFIVCMDEALFAGDKKANDRLKSYVTESSIHIEQKYQPARSIDSVHRFFAASNHEHFASVDNDDRRFLFLKVSEKYQRDTNYFGQICTLLSDPKVIGAMVYELSQKDITEFNVRSKPETLEHARQKVQSLRGFYRYWFEVLSTGNLSVRKSQFAGWHQSMFIATHDLVAHYVEFDRQAEKYQTYVQSQAINALLKICPSAQSNRTTLISTDTGRKEQRRGFILPDLSVARDEFTKHLRCSIEWDYADDCNPISPGTNLYPAMDYSPF